MKIFSKWIFLAVVFSVITFPLPAKAEIKDGITPCGSVGRVTTLMNGYSFVCAYLSPKSKKMVFRKLQSPEKSSGTVIVYAQPKSIPTKIQNTSTPWPLPSGDLAQYPGIKSTDHAIDLLGLKALNESGITGKGYSIAFIDSFILKAHPTFATTSITCINADPQHPGKFECPTTEFPSHGQGVAGTIGGSYGVATGANLISISGSMVAGLEWVLNNYKEYKITAVSLSIGASGPRSNSVCGVGVPEGLKEVLEKLAKEDVAVLFSTANQATLNWVREPNCMPGVISVASVNATDPKTIAIYSSISPDIDLLAPSDFYSAGMNGKDERFGGTSQATPFAAALFALGKQARPDANIAQIFYYMKLTAAPIDDEYVKNIPVVRPVEMVAALKAAKELPPIKLVKEIQVKSGG